MQQIFYAFIFELGFLPFFYFFLIDTFLTTVAENSDKCEEIYSSKI